MTGGFGFQFITEPLIRFGFQCVLRVYHHNRYKIAAMYGSGLGDSECILLLQLHLVLRAELAASSNSRFSHAIDKYSMVRNIDH